MTRTTREAASSTAGQETRMHFSTPMEASLVIIASLSARRPFAGPAHAIPGTQAAALSQAQAHMASQRAQVRMHALEAS